MQSVENPLPAAVCCRGVANTGFIQCKLTARVVPTLLAATYTRGQMIEVHVMITTNHYGRIEMRLCPAGATDDKQCQKLQR